MELAFLFNKKKSKLMASSVVPLVVSIQSVGWETSWQVFMILRDSRFFVNETHERGLSVSATRSFLCVLSNLFFAIAQDFFRVSRGAAVPRIVVLRNSSDDVAKFVKQSGYLRFSRVASKRSYGQHSIAFELNRYASRIQHNDLRA